MENILIPIKLILPRTEVRLKNINQDYPPSFFKIPIKVIYAIDIKKFIIVDGHHRYYKAIEKDINKLYATIFGIIKYTKFKNDLPLIDFKKVLK